MTISTWNLMRPNSKTVQRNRLFIDTINKMDPDVIILTETNSVIDFPDQFYRASTEMLPLSFQDQQYQPGENRATIFSKYPIIKLLPTADNYASVCAEIATPMGDLCVYATIVGFRGGKHKSFEEDIEKQLAEIAELSKHKNLCLCGDLNISFSGYPYPGKAVIKKVNSFFETHHLVNVTAHLADNAMHNVFSSVYLGEREVDVNRTEVDKRLPIIV